ncbi:hypothetical protein Pst134EA_031638 [Puccinia striiformis f. sp. tritici]|uniref:uncharacterized protein n=1 Tax=Puccinia striiformis f. sp. tritici TaxID=168172 RepID=UPI002008B83A|nr:uncharacterized protein Pst134EA_031638 [Puccinia striiformis f. sp. tritici]KAH9442705.1 hypothetical protein Pst134EA_031638 [Puccinia striiformis f. sp. tritici]
MLCTRSQITSQQSSKTLEKRCSKGSLPADSLSPLSSSLADHDEANRVAGSKEVKPGDNLKTDENSRMTANQDGIPVSKATMGEFRIGYMIHVTSLGVGTV